MVPSIPPSPSPSSGDAGSSTADGSNPSGFAVGNRRLSVAQSLAVEQERRLWDRRAESWDDESSTGLAPVVQAVLDACEPTAGLVAVDLGCGSGQVTIPLAERCEKVLGVDVSPRSVERMRAKCAAAGITNLEALAASIEALELAPGSLDLVVSNYAMHHLRDAEKARVLSRALLWLRPGGRLVIGDMMFGRGSAAEDRQIVAGKIQSLIRRGPAGWWRIAKNLLRFSLRLREKPLPRSRWETLAREAGFVEVRTESVRAEAGLLLATKPGGSSGR